MNVLNVKMDIFMKKIIKHAKLLKINLKIVNMDMMINIVRNVKMISI
jgi:hypothetical protein